MHGDPIRSVRGRRARRVRRGAALVLAAGAVVAPPSGSGPWFELRPAFVDFRNRSGPPQKESIAEMIGAGVCVLDYDGDGDGDLYFPNGRSPDEPDATNRLFRNEGGLGFDDATVEAGVGDGGWGAGCAVADLDHDGDPDLYVTNRGPNVLYRNNGDGTFTEVAEAGGAAAPGWSTGAAFGDLDRDGSIDLYVAGYIDLDRVDPSARCRYFGIEVFCGPDGLPGAPDALFRGGPEGLRFARAAPPGGVDGAATRGFNVLFVDLDGDGLAEIHVANDATMDLLFANRGGFRFEDVSLLSGVAFSGSGMAQSGMGSTAGDADGDGDVDLYVTNFHRDYNTLFRNEGGLLFTDATVAAGLALPTLDRLGWGAHFLDANHDGALDLFVANGHIYSALADHPEIGEPYAQENQLFLGDGRGRFVAAKPTAREPARVSRGTAVADLDGDGALDIVVTNLDERPDLYLGRAEGPTLRVRLVGVRSNRDGLGAVVTVDDGAGARSREMRTSDGYLGSNEPVVHVPLVGEASEVVVEIAWPSGERDRCVVAAGRRELVVKETRGCSFSPSP